MFMSNYEYIIFHGFYALNSVACHCNRSTCHMAYNQDLSNDNVRCRELREEHEIIKGKERKLMKETKTKRPW